jgi:O-antigen ligase
MIFSILLWLCVWGGMFTGLYNLEMPKFTASPFDVFQGLRALSPLLAFYLCLLWLVVERPRASFLRSPLGFLLGYGTVGIAASVFLTLKTVESLYWVGVFVAPILVVWLVLERVEAERNIEAVIAVNYAVFFIIGLYLFPESLAVFLGRKAFSAFYSLPFGLGDITKNGAGRFALVVVLVSLVRVFITRGRRRFPWLAALIPALFVLVMTQSRTALLGFGVAGILFVFLWGMDYRFLIGAPVAAFLLWTSGFKWRAQGSLDLLMSLSGRELTWRKGLAQVGRSPWLGWGFNADRLMLRAEHMHNSWIHAAIQTGVVGLLFFAGAFVSIWLWIFRSGLFRSARTLPPRRRALAMESVLIIGFLTARSFFESSGAFFGVDLLLLVPAMAYVVLAVRSEPTEAA